MESRYPQSDFGVIQLGQVISMKKLPVVILLAVFGHSLYGQSTITMSPGANISISAGANVAAGNRDGTLTNAGTFNSRSITFDPVATAGTSASQTSFIATWNASAGAAGYKLDVSADPGFGGFVTGYQNLDVGSSTTRSVTGLTAGTTYYYRVRAYDIDGITGYSNVITQKTAPSNPVAASATNILTASFIANWSAVTGATGYYLDVAPDTNFTGFVTGWQNKSVGNVTTFSVNTSLAAGTKYYYRVRASNPGGTSDNSNTIAVLTVPSAPVVGAATAIAQAGFTVPWNATAGATKYYIDVSTVNTFASFVTGWNNADAGNVTTYPVGTGLTAGSTYYCRVRSNNASGTSTNSNVITVITIPPNPVAVAATAITQTSFSANWNASATATKYFIDVATDNLFTSPVTGWTDVDMDNGTTFPVGTNLTAGTGYYYRLRASSASGTSGNSNVMSLVTVPPAPVTVAATNATNTSFSANWNAADGATKYYLDVSTDNAFSSCVTGWDNVDVGNVTTHSVNTNLAGGITYYYRVRANNTSGTGVNSNKTTITLVPPEPVANAATGISTTSFTANWSAVTSATNYVLDVATENTFTTMVTGWSGVDVGNVTTSAVNTNLAAGTTYYYRVRAANATGTSGYSVTITLITAPVTPVATSASDLASTSFKATWNAVSGAGGYYLDVATNTTFNAGTFVTGYENLDVSNVTGYSVSTNLTGGTTYYYRVRSYNSGGSSTYSNTITLMTSPGSPIPSAATLITASGFTANWNSSATATAYRLDVSTASDFSSIVAGFNNLNVANVLSYAVSGLNANTSYYYRVRAEHAYGTSGNSEKIAVLTAPEAPTTLGASPVVYNGFTANWNSRAGATGYYLDVSTASDFSSYVTGFNSLDVGNVTSYLISGLSSSSTYYYRVRAYSTISPSGNSDVRTVVTLPPAPVASAATAITATSFTANWNASTAATGYRLDVATDAAFTALLGSYNDIDATNVTSKSITGLTPGTTYYYRVRAYNGSGANGSSNIITVTSTPSAPTVQSATSIVSNGFSANWSAASGATGYQLDVSTVNTFASFVPGYNGLDVGNVLTYPLTGLSASTAYYYQVRAYNTGGASSSSLTENPTTAGVAPRTPGSIPASSIATTSFDANWAASTGATKYYIDVATNAGFTAMVAGWDNKDVGSVTTFLINTGLSAGTTYYYQVRAANADGTSGNSASIAVRTLPGAPTTLVASSISSGEFTANWNSTTGATGYYLDVSTNSDFSSFLGGFSSLDVGSATSYLIPGLSAGTTYYYRVRGYNTAGPSVDSDVRTVLTLSPSPVASAATAITATSADVSWSASSAATGYKLDVATNSSFSAGSFFPGYEDLNVGNVLTYAVSGLMAGTTFYYQVRASNASGTNGNSNVITFSTIPPPPVEKAATSTTTNGFTANWNDANGATGYKLDVATNSGFGAGTFVSGYHDLDVGNALTYPVTGLSAGTAYYYEIRAYNTGGTSGNSGTVTSTTPGVAPRTPASVPASGIAATSFDANWAASTGATKYYIDVATNAGFTAMVAGWDNKDVGNVTTYLINTGLSAGTTYYYQVRAANADGTSGNSSTITLTTVPSAPVEQDAANITNSSFDAKWSASTGATGYRLDVSTDPGFIGGTFVPGYQDLDVSNVTTFTVTGLTGGTPYYYQIRAYNAAGTSLSSGSKNPTTLADPAGTVTATPATSITETSFSANWTAYGGAADYRLDVATTSGFIAGTYVAGYDKKNVGNVTTFSVSGLTDGTTYYYRVYAWDSSPAQIAGSGTVVVETAPAAPTATAATSMGETFFTANWSASAGATGYYLDVATDNPLTSFVTGFNNTYVNNVTSYSVTGLAAGTQYYYQIRAKNGSGTSSSSVAVNTYTIPKEPTTAAASAVQSTSFVANWAASTGATKYFLDVSTDPTCAGSYVTGWNNADAGSGTSFTVNANLATGTTYYYRLRAYNSAGTSGNSTIISVTTAPAAPILVVSGAPAGKTSFTATWLASTGATKYLLDVATNDGFGVGTFVPGYENRDVGSAVSVIVNGLAEGTTYCYRVRAFNSNGTSGIWGIAYEYTQATAPAALPVTVIGETSFTAAWNGVTGATKYHLDVATDGSFGSFVGAYNDKDVGNVTSESITGLSSGTTYYFRVRAYNALLEASDNSGTISTATAPPQPTATAATSWGETYFTANWNASTGATGYYLDVATDNPLTSFVTGFNNKYVNNVTSYSITGLLAGTQYYYQLQAKNGSGTSISSGTISTYTIPKEPTTTAASAVQSTSFTANWAASTGATKYFLDVATDAGFLSKLADWNDKDVGNVTNYSINTGLSAGTSYYYQVRACNGAGTSGNSRVVSVTTAPAAPTIAVATAISKTSFTANWAASTGATKYFLDVATANTFDGAYVAGYGNLDVGNATSIVVNGLAQGVPYYYRVRAFNSNGFSGSSGIESALTLPAAPAVLPVTVVGTTNFTAAWNSVTGATGYYLDVSTSSTFASYVLHWQNVNVGNVTSKSVNTDLSAATTYYIRVKASNATGTGDNSETITTGTAPPEPTATAATFPGETNFLANWNASAGATGYQLDVATASDFSSLVPGFDHKDVGNVTSYTVTGLTGGGTYYYRVSAYLGNRSSAHSNTVTALATPTAPAATSATSIGETSLSVNWSSVAGASGYRLDVATSSGFTSFVAGFDNTDVSNVTTFSIPGLSANTTYYYRIRAYNASGAGSNSNTMLGLTLPAAPTPAAATSITNTTLHANWNASASVSGYKLDVSTDPLYGSYVFGFENKDVGNVTTCTVTGLNGGLTYYYRVRAYNSSGIGASSGSITTRTGADPSPAPVAIDASTLAQTSFSANWNAAATATGYKLDVGTDFGFTNFVSGFEDLNVNNVTTFSVTGLTTGTTYYFRTRSYNGTGTSSNSNVKTVLTVPANPTSTAATILTETSFTANWTASLSASTYYIDVSTDPSFGSFVGVYSNNNVGNVTTLPVTGLSTGTTYYYRVRANNASGTSGNSGNISVLTKPAAPVASAATTITTTGFGANWAAATGASTYYLDVSTDPAFGSFVTGYNDKDVGNVVTYPVTSLTPSTTYYYRVRASNPTGTGGNSGTITVVGIPTVNAATSVAATGFDANWNPVGGATRYYLDVATDGAFTNYVAGYTDKDVGDVTSHSLAGLTPGTIYYFRVRASNATGTSPSSNFKDLITITADPVATAAGSVLSTSFSANWNAVAGAAGYYVSVAVDSPLTIFVTGWENKDVGNATTYSIATNIQGSMAYYYQLRAYNAGGVSGSSNIIDVHTRPSVPVLTAATAVSQTGFTINWEPCGGATKYYLDVSIDSTFVTFLAGLDNKDVGNVTAYPLSGLTAGTRYYYRLRASSSSGTSASSPVGSSYLNCSPVLASIESAALNYREGAHTVISQTLTVSDNDNTTLRSARVEIINNYVESEDQLSFPAANGISGTWNPRTGILTLDGISLVANYQAALRSVAYNNSSPDPNLNTRTIRFSVSDSTSTSNVLTRNISITAVNNAPRISGVETAPLVFQEGSTAQVIAGSLTIDDPDNTDLKGAVVSMSGNYVSGEDLLSLNIANGIPGNWNPQNGVLTLSGVASIEAYQAALRSMTYQNTSENPSTLQRTISITVMDEGGATNTATRMVNIVATDDPSVLSSIETESLNFTEGGEAIAVTGAIVVSDLDDTLLTSAVAQVTRNYQTGFDSLGVSNANGITGSWNASTGTLALSGASTLANYQAALRSIVYRNTSVNPGSAARTISITVNDSAISSNTVSRAIGVTPINTPPVLSSNKNTMAKYVEYSSPPPIADSLVVRDLDNLTLRGASISFTGNYLSGEDILSFTDGNGISGSWNPQAGILTLSGEASIENYQAVLGSITYTNPVHPPSLLQRTVTIVVNDGIEASNAITRSISIVRVNLPPTMSDIESEGATYTVKQDELPITNTLAVKDVDSPELMRGEVRISNNYMAGEDSLLYNTQNGIIGSWETASGALRLSGKATIGNYQAALRSVRYLNKSVTPTSLPREVSFSVNDGESTCAATKRMVAISGTNVAPVLSGIESGTLKYSLGDIPLIVSASITASDPDNKNILKAEVKIIQGLIPDEDSLLATLLPTMHGQYDTKTGVLSISGQNLVSLYSVVLQSVKYQNNRGREASKSLKRISYTVWDGAAWSSAATRDIDVEGVVSSVETLSEEIPKDFMLRQNFPNPFNPSTTVHFGIPIESRVTLTIYDLRGRTVKTLADVQLRAGSYKVTWKAANLSSGVYFCRMAAVGVGTDRHFSKTKKLMLVK